MATITLIVQILFFIVLSAGVAAQLKGKYKLHDRLQAPVVVLNIFFIIFVIIPTFRDVLFGSDNFTNVPTLVTIVHGTLGTIAQGLAIYCLLAGFKILPRKIGVLRYFMWAAFIAWFATLSFGIGVYLIFYTGAAAAPDQALVAEHDADLAAPPADPTEAAEPETLVEPIDEHAAEAIEAEVTAIPTEDPIAPDPTEEVVGEHAAELSPAPTAEPSAEPTAEPTAELISEHDAEPVEPEAPPVEPEAPAADTDTFPMDDLIDEHMGDVQPASEPEYTGELGYVAWEQLTPANNGPGARYEHALQYNAATNQIFLFGGRDGSQIYNDVWVMDLETLTWRQLAANASVKPPARFSAVMIVDEAGQNLYVATGHTQSGGNFNDIWRLNLATENWQELSQAAGQPPAIRYGAPGGNIDDNLITTHGFGTTRYDDTWRFNTASGQWENITPAGPLPLKRCLFAAAPVEGNLVIHGGCATPFGECFLDDTWLLDPGANAWRQVLSDFKPVGRQHQSLVGVTGGKNKAILFGGQDASRAARDDAWLLDLATGQWQLVDSQNGPAARYNHAAVWVPGQGMILYGGRNDTALDDMWLGRF